MTTGGRVAGGIPQPLPTPPPLAEAMTTGAGSLNAGVPVEAPGVVNDVVIEGVESGAGFEATAVGAMVGVVAVGVMLGTGMESAGAIGDGVTETGEPPAVTVGPGFAPVGSGVLVKEDGVAGWLAGAPVSPVAGLAPEAVAPAVPWLVSPVAVLAPAALCPAAPVAWLVSPAAWAGFPSVPEAAALPLPAGCPASPEPAGCPCGAPCWSPP
jgi:hypothetical protein